MMMSKPYQYKATPPSYKADSYRADGTDAVSSTVEVVGNHVYFYSDIDTEPCLKLMQEVRKLEGTLHAEHYARGMDGEPQVPIWLHMQSYGGSLFTGFSVADQLAAMRTPVYSIVEGVCASAATLISMACTRRYILPNSFMLVHQLTGFKWGTHEQFKDEITVQEMLMERIAGFYAQRSDLSKDELRKMLVRDFWMDAETCIKHKFVDEILGSKAGGAKTDGKKSGK